MAGDVEVRQPKQGKGLRHKKRRVNIRIDMTPMVDVAFLLLIFFMVTTVFRQPQAMEMNMPPPDAKVKVAESNVLSIFVAPNSHMFYQMGGKGSMTSVGIKELHTLFLESSKLNPQLIILVKLNREAPYKMMVDIMDELEMANMQRFSLVPMSDEEAKKIEAQI
jgi:biopolymer transport protein ExbD